MPQPKLPFSHRKGSHGVAEEELWNPNGGATTAIHITDLTQLDEKLAKWGDRGWELATMIHAKEPKQTAEENILASEGWTLIFKQAAQ